ncbi:hypothetical protein [Paracoccus contaminans]|uniref:Uncharacterized protein n=1 Tax=Paracoccus contaminans TaxID=1945662 RepID=A0A1W6CYG3_9RHOB|nr:hypothetical protein [Paracoccus contaminans]ARJ69907.1 hypothetical protein B0A89_09990 [Paracoccus contaminans]
MQMPAFTMLNHHARCAGADAFRAAALARRLRGEGEPGIICCRRFVNAGAGRAPGVVDHRGGAARMRHHGLAMARPEMQAKARAARLERSACAGDVSPAVPDGLAASSMQVEPAGGCKAAGFVRG